MSLLLSSYVYCLCHKLTERSLTLLIRRLEGSEDGEVLKHLDRQQQGVRSPQVRAGPQTEGGKAVLTLSEVDVLGVVKRDGDGLQ